MQRADTTVLLILLTLFMPAAALAGDEFGAPDTAKVRVSKKAARDRLKALGGKVVADYDAYTVLEVPRSALDGKDDVEVVEGADTIHLRSGRIDIGTPGARQLRSAKLKRTGKSLHLVQFAGPPQPAWIDELRKAARVVAFIPSNAYLVYGDASQLENVRTLATIRPQIQFDAPFLDDYKLDPRISRRNPKDPNAAGPGLYTVQMVADADANKATLAAINRLRSGPIHRQARVLDYSNVVVTLPADKLAELAKQPDVVAIQPYSRPRLFDERQDQIVAGNITGTGPTAPGYLSWLASRGFTQAQFNASGFVVDVTDSGVDNATTSPYHFGLYESGIMPGTSRVIYNRLEGTPNANSTLKGCDGHGNLNAHVVGGFSDLSGFPFADGSGYRYGLGVAPFVKLGSSVIFDPNSFTFPNYASLQSKAYNDNARISSNSWGADTAGLYDADAQAYDALVRDAQPASAPFPAAGNQEMVIIFASGNAGPAALTVGSPGSAKNVICVGASEGVQSIGGSDACGTPDSEANSTEDMATFSSRGPCADGRKKPDLVAPGTHISGGVVQTATPGANGTADACYNGEGVCGGVGSIFFPAGQQFYTASTGTSHATPAVSGGAALLRQFFINHGWSPPSPALTKALLINSARYMTGTSAGDTLWSIHQGMGALDLGSLFARGTTLPSIFRDQLMGDMFTASGQARYFTASVANTGQPLRVTLAWTDAPGPINGNAYMNDLDLEVVVAGVTYKGNVFSGSLSTTGGSADSRNNVESVFLPAGTSGTIAVVVKAININSDGVPNVGGPVDQDFALVISNANPVAQPVLGAAGASVTAESCPPAAGTIDPDEAVTVELTLINYGTAATSISATLQATGGVTMPTGPQVYGPMGTGDTVTRSFSFTAAGSCGNSLTATLNLSDNGSPIGSVVFTFPFGTLAPAWSETFDFVSPPAIPSGWVATLATGSTSLWMTTAALSDSSPNSAFGPDPSSIADNRLTSPAIAISSTKSQLSFRHRFGFEVSASPSVGYDGGVLEMSVNGGAFNDVLAAGASFVTGAYNATISSCCSNPLVNRQAWSGNSGAFMTTTVNLPASLAGNSVRFRWRIGSDSSIAGNGWYVDSVTVSEPTCCVEPPACNTPFADADGDGDVDSTDYGFMQPCAGKVATANCFCFDRNFTGMIDDLDIAAFIGCISGSNVPANPLCSP